MFMKDIIFTQFATLLKNELFHKYFSIILLNILVFSELLQVLKSVPPDGSFRKMERSNLIVRSTLRREIFTWIYFRESFF